MMNLNGIKALPTGNVIDLRRPKDYKFTVEEIAKLLHKVKRFNGFGISVCSHSVYVASTLYSLTGNPHIALRGLFHDAQEAYIGDLATPVKDIIGSEWDKLEIAIHDEILGQLGIRNKHNLTVTPLIKLVDAFALLEEVRWLEGEGRFKRDEQGVWDQVFKQTPELLGYSHLDLTGWYIERSSEGFNDFITLYDELVESTERLTHYVAVKYTAKDGEHTCYARADKAKYFQEVMGAVR